MASLGLWTLPFFSLVSISPNEDPVNLQSGLNLSDVLVALHRFPSTCWIVHSNQVCGVLSYHIKKRYHRRRSKRNVVRSHGTIHEDMTSPVNLTWAGHRMVCNVWQGVYYSVPHEHSDVLLTYACNAKHQTSWCLSAPYVSRRCDTWCKYFMSNRFFNEDSSTCSTPSVRTDYSSQIYELCDYITTTQTVMIRCTR